MNKLTSSRLLSYWDIKIETHRASPYEFELIKEVIDENLLRHLAI